MGHPLNRRRGACSGPRFYPGIHLILSPCNATGAQLHRRGKRALADEAIQGGSAQHSKPRDFLTIQKGMARHDATSKLSAPGVVAGQGYVAHTLDNSRPRLNPGGACAVSASPGLSGTGPLGALTPWGLSRARLKPHYPVLAKLSTTITMMHGVASRDTRKGNHLGADLNVVQPIRPCLHHLAPALQVGSPVIGPPQRIAYSMG